jgi:hypothetical protein
MESETFIAKSVEIILNRMLPGGGFAQRDNSVFRPDATAWAIIALSDEKPHSSNIQSACRRMVENQLSDGRVVLSEGLDTAWWPTPIAALAWKKTTGFESAASAAVNFMLNASGLHFPKDKDAVVGHDTTIRGWPWIENTHSWIEPTCLTVLALKAAGYRDHVRVLEAKRMILDRQLKSGGWNYGNTSVFQKELLPMPDHTGQALCALSGMAQRLELQKSIDYAEDQLTSLTSPLSLCWCLFGLKAWAVETAGIRKKILRALSLQEKYGPYDTTLIAKLTIAYRTEGDLLGFFGIG